LRHELHRASIDESAPKTSVPTAGSLRQRRRRPYLLYRNPISFHCSALRPTTNCV